MKYPRECPVFVRSDEVSYVAVDIEPGWVTLQLLTDIYGEPRIDGIYRTSTALLVNTRSYDIRPATHAAKEVLALARGK